MTALALVIGGFATLEAVRTYLTGVELGLPGTSFIRVDRQRAEDLRWVTSQLSRCSASYSIPGLYSFSLWTGQALPTTLNVNAQLNLLSLKQQEAIVDALSREADLCVVYNPGILKLFDRGQAAANPPLLKFVSTAFEASSEQARDISSFAVTQAALSGVRMREDTRLVASRGTTDEAATSQKRERTVPAMSHWKPSSAREILPMSLTLVRCRRAAIIAAPTRDATT